MNNLGHSWMYERLDGRGGLYSRFVTEVGEFIQFACSQPNRMSGDKVRCPCAKCQNYKFMDVKLLNVTFINLDLLRTILFGSIKGKVMIISGTSYGNELHGSGQPTFGENPYQQMILDAASSNFSQGSSWQSYNNSEPRSSHPFQNSMEEDPNPVSKKFYDLLDTTDAKLYPGSYLSQLAVVSRMLNIKIENNMSQRGYNQMMKLLKESLPEDNIMHDSYYQTKKLVRSLGLPVEKIDCCESGLLNLYYQAELTVSESPDSVTETVGCVHLTDMPQAKLIGVQSLPCLERYWYRTTSKDICYGVSPNLAGDTWD
ncbi:hypothetical protein CQW23_21548 [Capsicum baccatum]|uniref:Transposase-associated domain-containing protein n=1 Tax=Capsicum baccatum TaxID=33114 RepID=A0A2G2VYC4_CAPBA|nr:hypothetical protein CQW23_21548 [Capsicum baccatum]